MDFYTFKIDTPLRPAFITVYSTSIKDARSEAIEVVQNELGRISRVTGCGAKAFAPDPLADHPIKACKATENSHNGYWAWFGMKA